MRACVSVCSRQRTTTVVPTREKSKKLQTIPLQTAPTLKQPKSRDRGVHAGKSQAPELSSRTQSERHTYHKRLFRLQTNLDTQLQSLRRCVAYVEATQNPTIILIILKENQEVTDGTSPCKSRDSVYDGIPYNDDVILVPWVATCHPKKRKIGVLFNICYTRKPYPPISRLPNYARLKLQRRFQVSPDG